MTHIRQVANVKKDGSELTLINVFVKTTNDETQTFIERRKQVDQIFMSVDELYAAIKANVNEVLTSGL